MHLKAKTEKWLNRPALNGHHRLLLVVSLCLLSLSPRTCLRLTSYWPMENVPLSLGWDWSSSWHCFEAKAAVIKFTIRNYYIISLESNFEEVVLTEFATANTSGIYWIQLLTVMHNYAYRRRALGCFLSGKIMLLQHLLSSKW